MEDAGAFHNQILITVASLRLNVLPCISLVIIIIITVSLLSLPVVARDSCFEVEERAYRCTTKEEY